MTKVRFKLPFLFLFIIALILLPVLTLNVAKNEPDDTIDPTMDEVIESDMPVISNVTTIINPYTDQSVT